MMRILITGSRTWKDEGAIRDAIFEQTKETPIEEVTIIHGAAAGADAQAEYWAVYFGYTNEAHPADWEKYGKRAGFIRNDAMVKLGADVCLAFIHNESRGASMCADLAEKAGIKTIRHIAGG